MTETAGPPTPRKAAGSSRQQAQASRAKPSGVRCLEACGHGHWFAVGEGLNVNGIVPADVELAAEVPGLGNPPGQVPGRPPWAGGGSS